MHISTDWSPSEISLAYIVVIKEKKSIIGFHSNPGYSAILLSIDVHTAASFLCWFHLCDDDCCGNPFVPIPGAQGDSLAEERDGLYGRCHDRDVELPAEA